MELERKRGQAKNGVIAGSVWETRMKNDDVKGGFNAQPNSLQNNTNNNKPNTPNNEIQVYKRLRPKQSVVLLAGKRKTWNSDYSNGSEKNPNPVQISKQRPEREKNSVEKCRELSLLSDGIKKSPVQIKKTRSDEVKELSDQSVDGFSSSPIHRMRTRAMWQRLSGDWNSISLRKLKSEENEKNSVGIKRSESAQSLEEFDLDNMGEIESPKFEETDDEEDDWDDDEIEKKKKSIVVKQTNVLSKEQKQNILTLTGTQIPANNVVVSEKEIVQGNERTAAISFSSMVRKQVPPPIVDHSKFISNPTYLAEDSDEPHEAPRTHRKLQSLVELVMWRDVSRSALIFGVGTFSIISSSYTKDLNISFISVISYLGVHLAAIFFFRYIINRGAVDRDDTNQNVVGEEEAIWVLKLTLPYINEFLFNVRALFSGEPATTMKLAVLLFVLARCGSSITIWKMAKLGFFVVFTIPKVCSSYSTQLTAFGTFWIRHFRDAWESCSHKKAIGFAIFTFVWNLSSVVARIWAVFMLIVGFKYYQQSLIKDEWTKEDATTTTAVRGGEDFWGQRQGRKHSPTSMENSQKLKKKI